jgi:hypothetical protein
LALVRVLIIFKFLVADVFFLDRRSISAWIASATSSWFVAGQRESVESEQVRILGAGKAR